MTTEDPIAHGKCKHCGQSFTYAALVKCQYKAGEVIRQRAKRATCDECARGRKLWLDRHRY